MKQWKGFLLQGVIDPSFPILLREIRGMCTFCVSCGVISHPMNTLSRCYVLSSFSRRHVHGGGTLWSCIAFKVHGAPVAGYSQFSKLFFPTTQHQILYVSLGAPDSDAGIGSGKDTAGMSCGTWVKTRDVGLWGQKQGPAALSTWFLQHLFAVGVESSKCEAETHCCV